MTEMNQNIPISCPLDRYEAKNKNYHGTAYELKLLMLFITRGVAKETPFRLASGVKEAGCFDDIVIDWQLNNRNQLAFLQSKHSDNPDKLIKLNDLLFRIKPNKKLRSDWCLQKYFESFLAVKKSEKFSDENIELKEFILCCNFAFDYDQKITEKTIPFQLSKEMFDYYSHDVLPNDVCKFKKSFPGREVVVSVIGDITEEPVMADIEEFLDKLVFAVEQPDELMLVENIKMDITRITGLRDLDLENIYSYFQTEVSDWTNSAEGIALTYDDMKLFFEREKKYYNQTFYEKIKALEMSFCDEVIETLDLKQALEKPGVLFLTNRQDARMSSIKVHQVLDSLSRYRDNNYLLTCLSDYVNLGRNILRYVRRKTKEFILIIECDFKDADMGMLKELNALVDEPVFKSPMKKLVLISKESDKLFEILSGMVACGCEEVMDDKNSICHLSEASQQCLLETRVITFQGKQVYLKDLLSSEDVARVVDDKTLLNLVTNVNVTVGGELTSLGDVADYYIDRKLNHKVRIDRKILKESMPDLFAISNIEESELMWLIGVGSRASSVVKLVRQFDEIDPIKDDPIRFIVLNNVNQGMCFQKLCHDYPEHSIHWLERADSNFVWRQSKGSLSNLRKHMDESMPYGIELAPDTLTNINEKVVIVTGDPGIGKSLLLTSLALKTQRENPALWILKVNPTDFTKELTAMPIANFKDAAINTLCQLAKFDTFSESLFRNATATSNRVTLLFDGLDEIYKEYQDFVINLLVILKESFVSNIWACARPFMRHKLEDTLCTFSYILMPLMWVEQKTFLCNFWARTLDVENCNEQRLMHYAELLLNSFYKSIHNAENNEMEDEEMEVEEIEDDNADDSRALGIPLHVKMLAEAYKTECREFYYSGDQEPKLKKRLPLLDLYTHFIDSKLQLFLNEKLDLRLNSDAGDKYAKQISKDLKQNSKILSLVNLFSDLDVLEILPENESILLAHLIESKSELHTGGILVDVVNGRPIFVHQTFAEFFAAHWFLENIGNDTVKQFLFKHVFVNLTEIDIDYEFVEFDKSKHETFLKFMDQILINNVEDDKQRCDFYMAVLNNDYDVLCSEFPESNINDYLNSVEKCGKSPLHLAATYGYPKLTKKLLEYNADIDLTDRYFGWSALQYADAFGYWDIVACLLDKGADGNKLQNAVDQIKRGNHSLLRFAVHLSSLKFVQILVENGADVNATDSRGNSPLHIAAWNDECDIMQYFVSIVSANFRGKNYYGFSPLHLAARHHNLNIIKCIAEKTSCDIDQRDARGLTPLQSAVESYSPKLSSDCELLEIVKYLVSQKADVQVRTTDNRSLLHLAVSNRELEIMKYLLEIHEMDVNDVDDNGFTAINLAARLRQFDTVKYLAESANADTKVLTGKSDSLLHFAARSGNLEFVKYLIEKHNSDVMVANVDGDFPIHAAACNGHLAIVKYFAESRNVELRLKTNGEETLVHMAAMSGNVILLKYLIEEQHLSLQVANFAGMTALHYAAEFNKTNTIKYLIDRFEVIHREVGPNISSFQSDLNFLDATISTCYAATSRFVNAYSLYGTTPLMSASADGKVEVAEILLNRGANYYCQNHFGHTALHYAVYYGHSKVVQLLMSSGANPYIILEGRKSLLDVIVESNLWDNAATSDVIRGIYDSYLTQSNTRTELPSVYVPEIFFHLKNGDLSKVKRRLDDGFFDMDSTDFYGRTLLERACEYGHLSILQHVMETINPELTSSQSTIMSLLGFSICKGQIVILKYLFGFLRGHITKYMSDVFISLSVFCECGELIEFLLKETSDSSLSCVNLAAYENIYTADRDSFLISCAEFGNVISAQTFLKHGADINYQNKLGETALHKAVKCEHPNVLEFLLENNADSNIPDKKGTTPLALAREKLVQPYGYHECVHDMIRLLEQHDKKS